MGSAPAIGIDLGTTFSTAAVYRNGKVEVIPNKEGQRLTPSFIFYNPHNLNVSVGTTAEDMGLKRFENFLFDIKRIIGRKYDDIYIQNLRKSLEYRFKIIRGENDMAAIEVCHDNVVVQKTPEEASSEILKYLRESASEYLGKEITEAVISVPAHFSNAQRKATRAAAELAGLKVLKLVTEPVAAAIHYAEDKLGTNGNLLVFDFGGGTLDVSIIKIDKKAFEVKSVEGDTFLGGRDFDQILLDYFKADIIRRFGSKIFTNRLLRRVKDACIRLKIKLSTENEYSLIINCIGGDEEKEYTVGISRSEFETLTESLYRRAIDLVNKCIEEAELSYSEINEVILVGGTTRIPKIRTLLNFYFNNKKLRTDINPDEAVALGAAVQAATIKEKLGDLEKYKITEVTPLSLGLTVKGGLMDVLIKKNTPLPFKSRQVTYSTVENNQERVIVNIYEGERKNCKYNNLLGSFSICNLPPGKAGTVYIQMVFSLNEDGILEIEAYETSNNKIEKLTLTIGEYRLCENKIKNAIEDAEKNKKDDEVFTKFIMFRNNGKKKCYHILYDINNIPSQLDREFVQKKCKEMILFSRALEYTQFDELRKAYLAFQNSIKGILQDCINVDLNLLISSVENINLSSSLQLR